jgi:two-component system OmpR family response regulator
MRILLAEDDPALGRLICKDLKRSGHTLDWLRDGQCTLDVLMSDIGYEALVLDLGLPSLDGHRILNAVRARHETLAVLVISGHDHVDNRIETLSMGADDYLTKPFDIRELLARILAVVRRKGGMPGPVLTNGQIVVNPTTHEVSYQGRQLQLSGREYDLLHALLIRPGAILSRAQLEERVYGWGQEVESNAIEFLIHAVRRKSEKSAIRNIRGVGWFVDKEF